LNFAAKFSYFSPFLKSIINRDAVEDVMLEENVEEREAFIGALESRFLFLAADARSTLRSVFFDDNGFVGRLCLHCCELNIY